MVEILTATDPLSATVAGTKEWNITNGASTTDVILEGEDKSTIIAVPTTARGTNTPFNLKDSSVHRCSIRPEEGYTGKD